MFYLRDQNSRQCGAQDRDKSMHRRTLHNRNILFLYLFAGNLPYTQTIPTFMPLRKGIQSLFSRPQHAIIQQNEQHVETAILVYNAERGKVASSHQHLTLERDKPQIPFQFILTRMVTNTTNLRTQRSFGKFGRVLGLKVRSTSTIKLLDQIALQRLRKYTIPHCSAKSGGGTYNMTNKMIGICPGKWA